jgi:DNA-nicking Smr family endonuclease
MARTDRAGCISCWSGPMTDGPSKRPRRRPILTEADHKLWRYATRDVVRLAPPVPDEAPPQPPAKPEPPSDAPVPAAESLGRVRRDVAAAKPLKELHSGAAIDLDKATAERFRRGQMPIEARLDLHGMTQDQAHRALDGFLTHHRKLGARCVLVITGKGGPDGGILRQAVPRWLNEGANRRHILAFSEAQAKHGGGGALYVLLKRVR